MRTLLLLPFLLGFSVPAVAHNEFNGGSGKVTPKVGVFCGDTEPDTNCCPSDEPDCVSVIKL